MPVFLTQLIFTYKSIDKISQKDLKRSCFLLGNKLGFQWIPTVNLSSSRVGHTSIQMGQDLFLLGGEGSETTTEMVTKDHSE